MTEDSRGTVTTLTRTSERSFALCADASTPCLSPSGKADFSVPSTLAASCELLLLQSFDLGRPLLEGPQIGRVSPVKWTEARCRAPLTTDILAPGCLSALSVEARDERRGNVLDAEQSGKLVSIICSLPVALGSS